MAKAERLPIIEVCPSRAALCGNPSDQHGGCVVAVPLWDFTATVTLSASGNGFAYYEQPIVASSFVEAIERARRQGPGEMSALVNASFSTWGALLERIKVKASRQDFTLSVSTTIPRQRGMGGSSAVITALFKALLRLHGLSDHSTLTPSRMAHIVMSVETQELMIKAGPQDRVVQWFCRPVLMDFSHAAYEHNSGEHGEYRVLAIAELPKMALLTSNVPSHSGKVHSSINPRDRKIKKLMAEAAVLAQRAGQALEQCDLEELGNAMQRNAEIRVEAFGSELLGEANMRLLEIAGKAKCPMNFTGSGGAAIVLLPDGKGSFESLKRVIVQKPYKGDFAVSQARFER